MFPIYIFKICLILSQWACISWILLETLRSWITLKGGLESAPLLILGIYSIFLPITFPSWKIIILLFHGMVAEDDLYKAFNLLKWKWSRSVIDSLWPHGLWPSRLLCPWDFPGKNTKVGCHFLLQRIFPPRDRTPVSCIAGGFFTIWAIREAHFNPLLGTNNRLCACYVHAKSLQSCPTLWDPIDWSPPGSSVHGILQARILEWVAISFSRGSSWPRNRTHVSYIACIGRQFFITSAVWETEKTLISIG